MRQSVTTQQLTRRTFLVLSATLMLTACGLDVSGNPANQSTGTALPSPTQQPISAAATATQVVAIQPAATQGLPTVATAPDTATPTSVAPTQPAASPAPPTATAAPATASPTAATAQAAPICTAGAVTPAQTEGPYYKANPPQRASLLQPGMAGVKLTITGFVLTADCRPIAGARVDFWQADASGQYDNSGYTLRGYQLTDATGSYTLETVVPGLYPGRTRHIHVKVSAPNGPVLTTQLYFPNEAANTRDGIYDARLLLPIQKTADGESAAFNFILPR